jgi:hypothetical protein
MPEIGTSGSMSEDEKRRDAHMAPATALILDSTIASFGCCLASRLPSERSRHGPPGNRAGAGLTRYDVVLSQGAGNETALQSRQQTS